MDQDPKNYRDPKVTTDTTRRTTTTRGSSMSWLWIAVAVVVGLLLLAWLFGWLGTDRCGDRSRLTTRSSSRRHERGDPDTEQGLGTPAPRSTAPQRIPARRWADRPGDRRRSRSRPAALRRRPGDRRRSRGDGQAVEGAADEAGETIDITPEAEAPADRGRGRDRDRPDPAGRLRTARGDLSPRILMG
jgi:hypothetical protein